MDYGEMNCNLLPSDVCHVRSRRYVWLVAPEVGWCHRWRFWRLLPRGDGTRPMDDRSYIFKQSPSLNSRAVRLNFWQFNSLSIARNLAISISNYRWQTLFTGLPEGNDNDGWTGRETPAIIFEDSEVASYTK